VKSVIDWLSLIQTDTTSWRGHAGAQVNRGD
jgi:hypothetical protein